MREIVTRFLGVLLVTLWVVLLIITMFSGVWFIYWLFTGNNLIKIVFELMYPIEKLLLKIYGRN